MDNKRQANRLDNYIRSYGTVLPKDIASYKSGTGDKRILCPFCDRHHDNNPIITYDYSYQGGVSAILTDSFSCDACNVAIERMSESISRRPDAKDMDDLLVQKNRLRNVGHFVNEGVFPPYAYLHVTHMGNDDFISMKTRNHKCVFCDSKLILREINSANITIPLPVGLDIYAIDGGIVPVCDLCADLIGHTIPELSFKGWLENTFAATDCARCGGNYLTTRDEEEARQITKTVGKYLCPKCAVINVKTHPNGPLYFEHRALDGKYSRYVGTECQFCMNEFSVDQMLDRTHTFEKHVTADGKLVCEDCVYEGVQPYLGVKTSEGIWTFHQMTVGTYAAFRKEYCTHSKVLLLSTTHAVIALFEKITPWVCN